MKYKKLFAAVTAFLILNACATMEKTPVELSQVLEQVNDAILVAQANANKDAKLPKLSSVKLDLQVGTSREADGDVTASIVSIDGEVERNNVQVITLLFVPKGGSDSTRMDRAKNSQLAAAISAIYRSVARANPVYQFKEGSVQLQCTFKHGHDFNEKGLSLIPIELGLSHSKQLVQTVTLNFGTDVEQNSAPEVAPAATENFQEL